MKKLISSCALAALIVGCGGSTEEETADVSQMSEAEMMAYADEVHSEVITLDTHDDINTSNFTEEVNYTQRLNTQINLPKMDEGELDVAWFVVYTGQGELTEEGYAAAYENADDKFKAIHRLCEEIAPDQIELAYTSDDVRRIVAAGKKVGMIGVENGYPIGTDLSRIEEFYERGARYMSLSHNGHSQLSDSNTGERDSVWLHNGLSDLGRQVIAEMNRLGMMIDLSHPSKEANMEMMRLSKAPVIASHSSARAVYDHSRNMDDEQLMMLKENGGVIQTVAFSGYVDGAKNNANRAKRNEVMAQIAEENGFEMKSRSELRAMSGDERQEYYTALNTLEEENAERIEEEINAAAPPVDVADFVNHIDYLVEKIGIDHVGISSDFDGGGGIDGWDDASETANVTRELVKRGYSKEEIAKIWSGNLLRVLDECQAIAAKIQAGEM